MGTILTARGIVISMKWGALVAVALASLFTCRPASAVEIPTIYDNHHPYPIGSRAAGMGGAYTALGCDEAALHYNVAALACSGASRLELSANIYLLQHLSIPAIYGPKQAMEASTYHGIPSIVGGVRVLKNGDDEGVGRLVFGLSVEVPRSLALKAGPKNTSKRNYLTFSVRDDLTTGDVGLGWQVGRNVAVGLGVGAALRTFEGHFSTLFAGDRGYSCGATDCLDFVVVANTVEHLALGARAKVGVRVTPTPSWAFGLAVTSPSINVFGAAEIIRTSGLSLGTAGLSMPTPLRLEGSSELSLPLRLALGAAFISKRISLSLDLSLNFPTDIAVADELTSSPIEGLGPPTQEEIDRERQILRRIFQPNLNIGAEVGVAKNVVIDFGWYTDVSSVSYDDVEDKAQDRVHMYGVSAALGFLGRQARGWFGLSFSHGRAAARVVRGDFGLDELLANGGDFEFGARSTIMKWNLSGFIGSNYSFTPDSE